MLSHLFRAGPLALAKLAFLSVRHFGSLRQVFSADRDSRLGQFRRYRPEMLGIVLTPFISARWTPPQRIDIVVDHCDYVETIGWPLDVGDHDYRRLTDLSHISAGLHIELAAPRWLAREGLLSLALVEHETLVFGLSFSFSRIDGALVAHIGGLQGGSVPDALATNRRMTRLAHGMRPRDLLIAVFRMICRHYDVTRILAVSDAARVHRSHYLSLRGSDPVSMHYDGVWQDRGGVLGDDGLFDLPLMGQRRTHEAIRPNKRGEYRRRYAMLDTIEADVARTLAVGAAGKAS